jgi:hypothetical protein
LRDFKVVKVIRCQQFSLHDGEVEVVLGCGDMSKLPINCTVKANGPRNLVPIVSSKPSAVRSLRFRPIRAALLTRQSIRWPAKPLATGELTPDWQGLLRPHRVALPALYLDRLARGVALCDVADNRQHAYSRRGEISGNSLPIPEFAPVTTARVS